MKADQIIAKKRPLGTDAQGRFPEAAPVPTDDARFGAIEGLLSWPCLVSMALVGICICITLYAAGVRV